MKEMPWYMDPIPTWKIEEDLTQAGVEKLLWGCGALLSGHFIDEDFHHRNIYIDQYKIMSHPVMKKVAFCIAKEFMEQKIDVIVVPEGPACGLAAQTADVLSKKDPVMWTFMPRVHLGRGDDGYRLETAYGSPSLVRRKRALLINPILDTGSTFNAMIQSLRVGGKEDPHGEHAEGIAADIVSVAVICNRGNIKPEDIQGVNIFALFQKTFGDSWATKELCPLCAKRVPIDVIYGQGLAYMGRQGAAVS